MPTDSNCWWCRNRLGSLSLWSCLSAKTTRLPERWWPCRFVWRENVFHSFVPSRNKSQTNQATLWYWILAAKHFTPVRETRRWCSGLWDCLPLWYCECCIDKQIFDHTTINRELAKIWGSVETQRLMPFFNRSNNEDLILAVQSAAEDATASAKTSQARNLRKVRRIYWSIVLMALMRLTPFILAVKSFHIEIAFHFLHQASYKSSESEVIGLPLS